MSMHPDLTPLASIAERHGCAQLWHFGSSLQVADPNDVDVAILGVPEVQRPALTENILRRYPGARIELDSYNSPVNLIGIFLDSPPVDLHVVLNSTLETLDAELLRSIRRGQILWETPAS